MAQWDHIYYINEWQRETGIRIRSDSDIEEVVKRKTPQLGYIADMWMGVILRLAVRFAEGSDTPVEPELLVEIADRLLDVRVIYRLGLPRTAWDGGAISVGSLGVFTEINHNDAVGDSEMSSNMIASPLMERPGPFTTVPSYTRTQYLSLTDTAESLFSLIRHIEEHAEGNAGPLMFCEVCGRWFERRLNVPSQRACSRKCTNRLYYQTKTKKHRAAARKKGKKKVAKKRETRVRQQVSVATRSRPQR